MTDHPNFYRVVHELYAAIDGPILGDIDPAADSCIGDPDRYEPDEHRCYRLAADLRVRLHAAGIRLSVDGVNPEPKLTPKQQLELATRFAIGTSVEVTTSLLGLRGAKGRVVEPGYDGERVPVKLRGQDPMWIHPSHLEPRKGWLERRASKGHMSITISETPVADDIRAAGFVDGYREGCRRG